MSTWVEARILRVTFLSSRGNHRGEGAFQHSCQGCRVIGWYCSSFISKTKEGEDGEVCVRERRRPVVSNHFIEEKIPPCWVYTRAYVVRTSYIVQ